MRRFSWLFLGGLFCLIIGLTQGCAKVEPRDEDARPGDMDGVQTYKRGVEEMDPSDFTKGKKAHAKKPAGT